VVLVGVRSKGNSRQSVPEEDCGKGEGDIRGQ